MLKRLSELSTLTQENFGSKVFWFSPVGKKGLQPGIEGVEKTIVHYENAMNES